VDDEVDRWHGVEDRHHRREQAVVELALDVAVGPQHDEPVGLDVEGRLGVLLGPQRVAAVAQRLVHRDGPEVLGVDAVVDAADRPAREVADHPRPVVAHGDRREVLPDLAPAERQVVALDRAVVEDRHRLPGGVDAGRRQVPKEAGTCRR
jgi:hypothetical protein